MQELEIILSPDRQPLEIEEMIESACRAQNLQLVSKNTLQKYSGCSHWHYKRMNAVGTLEITYWPAQNRSWFSIRNGRSKTWVLETVKQLKAEIERQVRRA